MNIFLDSNLSATSIEIDMHDLCLNIWVENSIEDSIYVLENYSNILFEVDIMLLNEIIFGYDCQIEFSKSKLEILQDFLNKILFIF